MNGQAQMEQQQKHYFDSIETDEFVMPNMFEVEIRLADNQVTPHLFQTFIDQNSDCWSREGPETKGLSRRFQKQ